MKLNSANRGFTLIELMIVVLIISTLTMLGWTAVQRINLRSRTSAYQNDCRVFATAFTQYAQEAGIFPADGGPHFVPPVMAPYLSKTRWMRVTPFGGYYDWNNIDSWDAYPARLRASIAVAGSTMTLSQLQQVDRWIDDGNIATGNFRVMAAGATVLYVIEP